MPIQIVKRTVETALTIRHPQSSDQTRFRLRESNALQSLYQRKKHLAILSPIAGETRTQLSVEELKSNVNQHSAKNNLSSYWQVQTLKDKIIREDGEITTTTLVKQSVSVAIIRTISEN